MWCCTTARIACGTFRGRATSRWTSSCCASWDSATSCRALQEAHRADDTLHCDNGTCETRATVQARGHIPGGVGGAVRGVFIVGRGVWGRAGDRGRQCPKPATPSTGSPAASSGGGRRTVFSSTATLRLRTGLHGRTLPRVCRCCGSIRALKPARRSAPLLSLPTGPHSAMTLRQRLPVPAEQTTTGHLNPSTPKTGSRRRRTSRRRANSSQRLSRGTLSSGDRWGHGWLSMAHERQRMLSSQQARALPVAPERPCLRLFSTHPVVDTLGPRVKRRPVPWECPSPHGNSTVQPLLPVQWLALRLQRRLTVWQTTAEALFDCGADASDLGTQLTSE